jgi:hypothetical protein
LLASNMALLKGCGVWLLGFKELQVQK